MTQSVEQPHEALRRLLVGADGETCRIVATFVDIRGFSRFSTSGESFDVAAYLRAAFSAILSDYFADANYFKTTGDGLLLVHHIPSNADGLMKRVSSILESSINLVQDFGSLTSNDPFINFEVPKLVGIGVARGSATRLVSDGHVLDYIGRCLNLAARLMDKARPHGVVFADERASHLMTQDVAQHFAADRVFIRGIAENQPIQVFATNTVRIDPQDREPPPHSTRQWGKPVTQDVSDVRKHRSYSFYMPRHPHSFEKAAVHVEYPLFDDHGKETDTNTALTLPGSVEDSPDGASVRIEYARLHRDLKGVPAATRFLGISMNTKVTFTPFYEPREK